MNKKDINKVTKISESLDWSITVDGNDFEFEKWSPAANWINKLIPLLHL